MDAIERFPSYTGHGLVQSDDSLRFVSMSDSNDREHGGFGISSANHNAVWTTLIIESGMSGAESNLPSQKIMRIYLELAASQTRSGFYAPCTDRRI